MFSGEYGLPDILRSNVVAPSASSAASQMRTFIGHEVLHPLHIDRITSSAV